MKQVFLWARQPSTLLALALLASAVAYWFTGSTALAAGAAAAVLGGVNDQTRDLLVRMETMEDAIRPAKVSTPGSALLKAASAVSTAVAAAKPVAGLLTAASLSSIAGT